ncbi:two-component system sensor histidine kinase NtrB [Pleionea litopenaei]|uniref:histidine kinase n=1 Tax=Pleionea litopenaei TaxID=3070815 RepID=A0AA51X8R5_9GAMM|nr:ATP-binding protein [Pleionea sp. HL-JVS1]WMS88375.1 ATP-binding protein [Pleionea sp. HL-JVS1]
MSNQLKTEHLNTSKRALQIYTLYRVIVAISLILLFQFRATSIITEQSLPGLFHWSSIAYLLSGFLFYFLNQTLNDRFRILVELQVFVDIILLTLLMHASGGLTTGLGILMAVSVTTACLLVERTSSIVFAAIATAAVLGEAIYLNLAGISNFDSVTQAGLLGATFFATSLFALLTARRLRQSELEAETTSIDLANMEAMNEKIIQFMKTGVIVINQQLRIQFINTAAWQLLDMPEHVQGQYLKLVSPELDRIVKHWKQSGHAFSSFRHSPTGSKIAIKLTDIDGDKNQVIIFAEDTTPMRQQAQNLKLASLGRLTASIAHEIRNPLGAMSHAAQLLIESPELTTPDRKLVDMIQSNSIRINAIIENIMQLSQRKISDAQTFKLKPFIDSLVQELNRNSKETLEIFTDVNPTDLEVNFDVSQLRQVVTNLSENGLRYSKEHTGKAQLSLVAGVNFKSQRVFLDVIDRGEGITNEVAQNIFEPFFTTSSKGTGLGLYVSKELCEANQSQLDYIPVPSGGSCFRITFARVE